MLRYGPVTFRHEPFPIGVAAPIFSEADYGELVGAYPPPDVFVSEPSLGRRYTLSRSRNGAEYRAHVRRQPVLRELQQWISSVGFVASTLEMLLSQSIDLGIAARPPEIRDRAWRFARGLRRGNAVVRHYPRAEMVFAMLPADGGSLLPHTDHPDKLVNIALPIVADGTWDRAVGGDTDVNRARRAHDHFNRTNRRLGFEDVDVIDSVPFRPNQALIVIRTDNSWHSIRPMTGRVPGVMRRTININLVRPGA